MNRQEIIQQLDQEIERLQRTRQILAGDGLRAAGNTESGSQRRGPRRMSADARARIAAAQRARWAKVRAQKKK